MARGSFPRNRLRRNVRATHAPVEFHRNFERWKVEWPPGGCWPWRGALLGTGEPRLAPGSAGWADAHTWLYSKYRGHIGESDAAVPGCAMKSCVNPDHLIVEAT